MESSVRKRVTDSNSHDIHKRGPRPHHALQGVNLAALPPGKHWDGEGLFLYVTQDGRHRYWRWKYRFAGAEKLAQLGVYPRRTLKLARQDRDAMRSDLEDGKDPVEARRRRTRQDHDAKNDTFEKFARDLHSRMTFGNVKHGRQWLSSLQPMFDVIGDRSLRSIDSEMLIDVLAPILKATPETGKRVRQRVRAILGEALVRKRVAINAALELHEVQSLKQPKRAVRHLRAMKYQNVPDFVKMLRDSNTLSLAVKLALEFCILTAARSGEVRGATWDEIDESAREWTIPAERMKMKAMHTVPLSDAALDVLQRAHQLGSEGLIFPSPMGADRQLSDMTLLMAVRRLLVGEQAPTVHGFRTGFSQWGRRKTDAREEAIEWALSHATTGVKGAYDREPFVEERAPLMQKWADFLGYPRAALAVVSANKRRAG